MGRAVCVYAELGSGAGAGEEYREGFLEEVMKVLANTGSADA